MSDIRDFFIKTLDDSATGIRAVMERLSQRLQQVDPAVAGRLDSQGIKMQFFAFRYRWLSELCTNELTTTVPLQMVEFAVVSRVLSA